MIPRPEIAHWLAASFFLLVFLVLLAEAVVGSEVFRRRPWRAYSWPAMSLAAGVGLWLIAIFSTFSTVHLLVHAAWAQAAMIAGAVQLAVVRGKLTSPLWSLVWVGALVLTGVGFLVHEQNPWLFSRSAFLHHALGWTFLVGALFPLGQALQPTRFVWRAGFAVTFLVVALLLYSHRDVAPIFGRYGASGSP